MGADAIATGAMTAHEQVYRRLRDDILNGQMEPGTSVTLRGLAAEMGVSMTPAREAVRRLVAERALMLTGSGRVLVPMLDAAALAELFEARRLIEPALAARAAMAARGDKALLARLQRHDDTLERAVVASDPQSYVAANHAFHADLSAAAGAPSLLALAESVWLQTAPTMRRVYGQIGTRALDDHHVAAMAAIDAGDGAAAAAAIAGDVAQGAALAGEASLDRRIL
ncbi:MAG: GntR family transcriptional regulator [Pseudomonadota bacterium]